MRNLLALGMALVMSLARAGQPVGDAASLLRHMLEASPKLRYTGTRTVTLRNGVDRRAHTELIEKDGVRTRVEFPKGSPYAGQVIVETERERRHFFPERNEIKVQPPRRERAFSRLMRMGKGPRLQSGDGGSVAGMHTVALSLSDATGNIVQRMWIEPRSGLLLKREFYDRSGAVQGGFEFTTIDLSPRIDPRDFHLDVHGAKIVSPRDTLHIMAKQLGLPEVALPVKGPYQLDGVRLQKFGGTQVLVQMYSGEDRRFSFFQLKGPVDQNRLSRQARNLQSVSWQRDGVSCVLVGDLPAAQLEALAHQLGK